jgi:putative transcriptional regulator
MKKSKRSTRHEEKQRDRIQCGWIYPGRRTVRDHVTGRRKITLRTFKVNVPPVDQIGAREIRSIRTRVNVSQEVFARMLNVPLVTEASWEKGRRNPSGAALRLLQIAKKKPAALLEAASAWTHDLRLLRPEPPGESCRVCLSPSPGGTIVNGYGEWYVKLTIKDTEDKQTTTRTVEHDAKPKCQFIPTDEYMDEGQAKFGVHVVWLYYKAGKRVATVVVSRGNEEIKPREANRLRRCWPEHIEIVSKKTHDEYLGEGWNTEGKVWLRDDAGSQTPPMEFKLFSPDEVSSTTITLTHQRQLHLPIG